MFNKQSDEISKEELRKKRRQKVQLQAYGILAAGFVVLILLIVGIGSGVSNLVGKANKAEEKKETEIVQKEEISEESDSDKTDSEEIEDEASSDLAEQIAEANEKEPEPEQTTEEMQKEALRSYVGSFIESMTIEEKVAGLFITTPESITGVGTAIAAGSSTSQALVKYPVGGILYDSKNIQDAEQFKEMIYNTKTFSKYELFVAISEEGGETGPLFSGGAMTEPVLSQKEIGATSGVTGAYSAGISIATTLNSLGVNVNFAPVSDIADEKSFIADRTYGKDLATTKSLVKNMLKGMNDQSIYGCFKYFPGHNDVIKDTKTGQGVSNRTKADLEKCEYELVKMAIEENTPFLMVSHVSMPAITGDNIPASLSSVFVTDMLRNELGYEGIIVTDYMNKAAITRYYKHADAAVMAIQAGVDMIVAPSDFKKAYEGVLKAVEEGEITEERLDESLYRIFMLKYKNSIDYSQEVSSLEEGEETDTEENNAEENVTADEEGTTE